MATRSASAPAHAGGLIAATKLHIPAPRRGRVRRGDLVASLAAARDQKLTLLTAPPGSGKTTLLAEWAAAEEEDRPFAWLSLDEEDDDPVRFWQLVLSALRTVDSGLAAEADAALGAPGTSLTATVVPLLVNDLLEPDRQMVLVLDDFHMVHDPAIHESLDFLVDHLPPALHVAMATRSDPPLALPRRRARGEVTEIRAADLRFSDVEAAALLNDGLGLTLDAGAVAQLQQRTEGWAAGLQLAGLSLRGRVDPLAFIASFAGDDRQITDYLGSEVLDAQGAAVRQFLLRTSVLERLCGSLCDAVTAGDDGAERLAQLERDNLFVVALDSNRRWYRYHHLFGELLRHRLRVEDPDSVADLHRRAARWYAEGDAPWDAIRHSLAAGDVDTAAELISMHWSAAFNRGHLMTVTRWLDALPEERLRADTRLWLARAWTTMDGGRLDEIDALLDADGAVADADSDDERAAWIALLRGLHAFKAGDLAAARAAVADTRAAPGEHGRFWSTVACIVDGLVRFWSREPTAAASAFARAVMLAWEDGNNLACVYGLGHLALLDLEHGEEGDARRRLEEVEGMLEREPQLDEHFTAHAFHLARGRLAELAGTPDESVADLDRALVLTRRAGGAIELGAALVERGRVARALGDVARATALLDEAEACASTCPDCGRLHELVDGSPPRRPARGLAADRDELSERELVVLRMLPGALSLREIGSELYVSLNTVKTHVRSIYLKLGAGSREEAVAAARGRGLL